MSTSEPVDGATVDAGALADAVHHALVRLGDSTYVAGTVAARHPGKPVLGIRIPRLRDAVRRGLRAHSGTPESVVEAADLLWHADFHEEELAACMMIRLAGLRLDTPAVRRWAMDLDNWLSVDELAGCVGDSLVSSPALLAELNFLALSPSVWQRRLFLAALIRPMRAGLDPVEVPPTGRPAPGWKQAGAVGGIVAGAQRDQGPAGRRGALRRHVRRGRAAIPGAAGGDRRYPVTGTASRRRHDARSEYSAAPAVSRR